MCLMKQKGALGPFEQRIITAVLLCRDDAYGMAVHAKVEELGGERCQLPAVYVTLDRLEEKGYVRSWLANATPERGNKRSRYFEVLPSGQQALAEAAQSAQLLVDGWTKVKWLKGIF